MCRLMYLPTNVRPPRQVLTEWMAQLESSFGGHGIGYATSSRGAIKGEKITPKSSALDITRNLKGAVIWHTRRASIGSVGDDLCHPFPTTQGSYLVHNGHWGDGAFFATMFKGLWSDTRVAALAIQCKGWKAFTRYCNNGVWLHLTPKGLQVHYASGSLWGETETGALCSEPCKDWGKWAKVMQGTYDDGIVKYEREKVRNETVWFPPQLLSDKPTRRFGSRPIFPNLTRG